jgi:hypothetical protein
MKKLSSWRLVFEEADDSLRKYPAERWIPTAFNGHILDILLTKFFNSHPMVLDILGRNRIPALRKGFDTLVLVDIRRARAPHSAY